MSLSTPILYQQPLSVFKYKLSSVPMHKNKFESEFHPSLPLLVPGLEHTTHTALHRAFHDHPYRCFQISQKGSLVL